MATAGVWTAGEGQILRPRDILFLSQQPYLPPGSLRQVLTLAGHEGELADERILNGLHELNLDHLLSRAGGFNVEQDWGTSVSLREQQLLTFLRVLLAAPQFVFADRAWATLTPNERRQLLIMLSKASIGYICNCETDGCRDHLRYGPRLQRGRRLNIDDRWLGRMRKPHTRNVRFPAMLATPPCQHLAAKNAYTYLP